MLVKVFLLGRPGSGKTTAFRYIEIMTHNKGHKATRFRDYDILHAMFQKGRKEFQPAKHGGFDVVDFSVLNESVQQLEEQAQEYIYAHQEENELIFIELARNEYKHTMRCFKHEFLQDSYFLFIEADVETCLERIYHRLEAQNEADGHFISEYIIRGYYGKENKNYMINSFRKDHDIKKDIMVIENQGSLEDFMNSLEPFAHKVLAATMVTDAQK